MQSGFEQNRVYTVPVGHVESGENSPADLEDKFYNFISSYRLDNEFIYR